MRRLNNKGITTVEVIVCFVLVTIISLSIYTTISNYNAKRQLESNKAIVYAYKNSMTKMIQDDFIKKGLTHASYTKKIADSEETHILLCDLRDGTKRKLVVQSRYTKSAYHEGSPNQDDHFRICYGDPKGEENDTSDICKNLIEYPLPDVGSYKVEKDGQDTIALDLSINNVMIDIKDNNVLSLYIGFYHPELTTRYGIDIVCPIDYISQGADNTNKFNVQDVQVKSVEYKFEPNGGTGDVTAASAHLGDTLKLPSTGYKKNGYKLVGWNTRSDGKGTTYLLGENINVPANQTTAITLYAMWQEVTVDSVFNYSGSIQTLEIAETGLYSLEVWGASGGAATTNQNYSSHAGLGGYSYGKINLTKGDRLYIVVGEQGGYGSGTNSYGGPPATYNGGGSGGINESGAGGGATHIARVSGLLSQLENQKNQILIVAGGGGGADNGGGTNPIGSVDDGSGGSGGGEIGLPARLDGVIQNNTIFTARASSRGGSGMGGTQLAGFAFGRGENVTYGTDTGGGGGGYFGGLVTNHHNGGAGGGSGYLNSQLIDAKMYCYKCENTAKTQGTTNADTTAKANYAKIGNGYARIKYISD